MPIRATLLRASLAGTLAFATWGIVRAAEGESHAGRSFAATALRASLFADREPEPSPSPAVAPPPAVILTPPVVYKPAADVAPPPPATVVAQQQPVAAAAPARQPVAPPSPIPAPLPATPAAVPAPAPELSWPRTLVEVRRAKEQPRATAWSKSEIDEARKACVALLKSLDVVALPVEPFRDGECGAPAAVQLVSLGRSPEVTFAPPPVVTCEMVSGLGKWIGDLQASARRNLGAPLIRIEVMSSYSCRNAYGRANARLSEHGRANALDISGFLTAQGYETAVLEHWGPNQRIIARTMNEKERALAAARAAPPAQGQPPQQTGPRVPTAVAATGPRLPTAAPPPAFVANRPVGAPPPPIVAVAPPTQATPTALQPPAALGNGMRAIAGQQVFTNSDGVAFAPPSRLGGPGERPSGLVVARDASPEAKSRFLKDIHDSACRIFGTVLGPEANRAHENHFHVDMAERKTGAFCE
jgi:hypothetical protein